MKPKLVLETGDIVEGEPLGALGETYGELVFNTSFTGYQEILTDPSYKGQIVVMTNPHIGNYGINSNDGESNNIYVEGFVISSDCAIFSNCRGEESLNNFLKTHNIVGIQNIDTRYITKIIRKYGSISAMITYKELKEKEYVEILRSLPKIEQRDLVSFVSTKKAFTYQSRPAQTSQFPARKVCVIDYGVKKSILNELTKRNFIVEVLPYNTSPEKLLKEKYFFYLFSNGPGDPQKVKSIAKEQIKMLIKENQKLFCICLGHQLVALALDISTYKLPFGHHGGNHPVKDMETNKIYITSQNHNFAVREDEAKNYGFMIKYKNLYDGTLEGMYHKKHNIFSVQFHPEAGPGPVDANVIFDCAIEFFNN
ncbi:MAG: glutamine-hydrolyzing carbamoyl-phosphate synthase small subunit [Planctomycetota bacterium]